MTLGQSPASTAPPPQQADNRIFAELDKLMYAKKVKSGDARALRLRRQLLPYHNYDRGSPMFRISLWFHTRRWRPR
jgi:hypothetical protein